jgi:hypothetical protein
VKGKSDGGWSSMESSVWARRSELESRNKCSGKQLWLGVVYSRGGAVGRRSGEGIGWWWVRILHGANYNCGRGGGGWSIGGRGGSEDDSAR